jgi:predicted ATP-grasp superfamily ATP-dependent carboligase
MRDLKNIRRIYSGYFNALYIRYKKLQVHRRSKPGVKILFPDHEYWKHNIRGFEATNHKITFGEFSAENIRNHDLIVPLNWDELLYLAQVRHLVRNNALPIPSIESVKLCDDKYRFNHHLVKNGFAEYIPKMSKPLNYPYILKKKIGWIGKNCHIISEAQQEEAFANKLNHPDYFVQEIIPGQNEYATHILFKDGEIACSLNIRYVFDTNIHIKGPDKAKYNRISRCPYLDLFASVLRCVGFEGLCCLNYKVRDNQPYIIEINPTCDGSLCPYLFSFIEQII